MVNENAELIPFEDAKQAAINHITYKKSFLTNIDTSADDAAAAEKRGFSDGF